MAHLFSLSRPPQEPWKGSFLAVICHHPTLYGADDPQKLLLQKAGFPSVLSLPRDVDRRKAVKWSIWTSWTEDMESQLNDKLLEMTEKLQEHEKDCKEREALHTQHVPLPPIRHQQLMGIRSLMEDNGNSAQDSNIVTLFSEPGYPAIT
ncbi:hypothetical protein EK904_006435 [Melospiza melodia maxima]|nr:hypothetical protein EK904_006435 [Melospiza melodia maxima]